VAKDDAVVCTFTNTRMATVIIHQLTDPREFQSGGDAATTLFGYHTQLTGAGTFGLLDGGTETRKVPVGTYDVTQDDPKPLGYKLTDLVCTETVTSDSTVSSGANLASERKATVNAQPGETIECTFTDSLVSANVVVIKAGTEIAYHGDTLSYDFTVTNNGNSPLHDVKVTDDRCPNVSASPTSKVNDNGNATLDKVGADGVNPEKWIFTCSMPAPAHVENEVNPVVNTATVNALDEYDRPVSAQAQHSTRLLHPGVAIDKTGPATSLAGSPITYFLAVTNTGDVSFAAGEVRPADKLCEAPPVLVSIEGDTSPATFDPADKWIYGCVVRTQLGQALVHNTGTVAATDPNGRVVTAEDTADTTLTQPQGEVKPDIIQPGTAKLSGRIGCTVGSTYKATVSGKRIASVTFYIDGKKKKTVSKADSKGRYTYTLNPTKLKYGSHRVRVVVKFQNSTAPASRELKLTFTRCAPKKIKPVFTG